LLLITHTKTHAQNPSPTDNVPAKMDDADDDDGDGDEDWGQDQDEDEDEGQCNQVRPTLSRGPHIRSGTQGKMLELKYD